MGKRMIGTAFGAVLGIVVMATTVQAQFPGPLSQPRPKYDVTIDNPHWTTDLITGRPRPTPSNPFWETDLIKGTPRPTPSNPFWRR